MKEDWTDQLRQKLEGFEMTPPEGLWEDICKEMGMPVEPASASHKRWYWAVAAAILALVGFFAVYLYEYHSEATVLTAKSEIKPIESKEKTEIEPKTEPKAETPQKAESSMKATPSTKLMAFKAQDEEAKDEVPAEPKVTAEPEETTETEVLAESEVATEPEVQLEPEVQSDSVASIPEEEPQTNEPTKKVIDYPELTPEPQVRTKKSTNPWSFGANASKLLAANTIQTENFYIGNNDISRHEMTRIVFPDDYYRPSITYFYPNSDRGWMHRPPIRFGLSVHLQLNNHIALRSGINYTYLYTDWGRSAYNNNCYEQELHYIGVPLGIAWKLLSSKHLHLYLSGGVMLEKCISFNYKWFERNPLKTEYVSKIKPWQFSVQAAAGIEYLFISQVGIYLEPSLGYYFHDGSHLQHYYKKRPFAPSFDFGFRLHLK